MKRAFDIAVAAGLAVALSPLLLVLAIIVKLDSPGPVIFRQSRVGRYNQPFSILKFRSMIADAPSKGPLITSASDRRITRAGKFMRRYKLDEVPQLWNVLVGEMSLVGPRPEVQRYVDRWSEQERRVILSVRPGITGPAAVKFFDEESLLAATADPERLYLDEIMPAKLAAYQEYIEAATLAADIKILWATLARVVAPRQTPAA